MLKYLQRITNEDNHRRHSNRQPPRRKPEAFALLDEAADATLELPDDTVDFDEAFADQDATVQQLQLHMSRTLSNKSETTVLMLPAILNSGLRSKRETDGLIDTGAERTIISHTLAKELGTPIAADDSKLIVTDGKEVKTVGKCKVKMQLVNGCQDKIFEVECLILPQPKYEFLLGLDFMAAHDIAINPRGRFISFNQTKFHCKTVGHMSKTSVKNRMSASVDEDDLGRLLEKAQHFPVQQQGRVLFPLNRSVILGPRETRMLKLPVHLREDLQPLRIPTIAPHFSVNLGPQYATHLTIAVTNHKPEPIRLTGKTVIFEVTVDATTAHSVRTHDGSLRRLRVAKPKSFQRRQ